MSESKLYYIYLDTKIVGTAEQLIGYFQAHVFNKDDCINVICKYYKEIEEVFKRIFDHNQIPYKFIHKQSDLSLVKNKTVFYLFNAQSNCRLVANRDLIHIFVTHGESHKLASVKPIIRIYDYVITSGQIGIERYLKSGIFSPYDVASGKLITLGDTFLGDNDFIYNSNSNAIVYAPTWEGGIPEENYCSLSLKNTLRIIDFCQRYNIKSIYIKPHPNIGHRDIKYKDILKLSVDSFQQHGLKVIINKNRPNPPWYDFLYSLRNKKEIKIEVKHAITDISAMEMQFINKKIPCTVLIDNNFASKSLIPTKLNEYYATVFSLEASLIEFHSNSIKIRDELLNYFITYPSSEIKNYTFRERVSWLCDYTKEHQHKYRDNLKSKC